MVDYVIHPIRLSRLSSKMQNSPEARVFSKRLSIGWAAFCAVFVFSQPLCGFLATAAKPFQRFDFGADKNGGISCNQ